MAGRETEGFFERVYAAVRAIPRGHVATYGDVASLLGVPRGARAVGWALRALSASRERVVPWHRVVGAGGRISLRGGPGPKLQRRRLRQEGVRFVLGCVDLGAARARYTRLTRGKPKASRARCIVKRVTASSSAWSSTWPRWRSTARRASSR